MNSPGNGSATSPDPQGPEVSPADSSTAPLRLTRGLGRNAVFNVIGWGIPVFLYLATTPYIVHGLGAQAFGVYGIISLTAGYLAFLNAANATGNIRFLAEAVGRHDWSEFRNVALAGLILSGAIGVSAGLLLIGLAPFVPGFFRIPEPLAADAITGVRLGAVGFAINCAAGALMGIPSALRRYDVVNSINVLGGIVSTLGVAVAVSLGYGILGAVGVQVLGGVITLAAFGVMSLRLLRRSAGKIARTGPVRLKPLFSFSALLAVGQIGTTIGLQMDKTVVGALMGPTAVAFYSVPSRVADQITGFLNQLTKALYPLAAEGSAAAMRDSVRTVYMAAVRSVVWLAVMIAVPVIALSYDLLHVWMGEEFASQASDVLAALAVVNVFRATTTVSSPIAIGLGRADVAAVVGWGLCFSYSIPVLLLARELGIFGAALGCIIGMAPLAIGLDIFVQRKLLNQMRWGSTIGVYAKPFLGGLLVLAVLVLVPFEALTPWVARFSKLFVAVVLCVLACIALDGPLVRQVVARFHLRRVLSSSLPSSPSPT